MLVLHGTKFVVREARVPVFGYKALGGDTVGVIAHEHVGEMRSIVHPFLVCSD